MVFREGFKYSHKKTRKIKWIDFLVFFLKNCIVLQTFFSYDNSAKIHSQKGGYMNTITELLNLEDSDILISDISVQGTTKALTLETNITNPL